MCCGDDVVGVVSPHRVPPARVRNVLAGVRGTRSGSNTFRKFATYACSEVVADDGGRPAHNASNITSTATD